MAIKRTRKTVKKSLNIRAFFGNSQKQLINSFLAEAVSDGYSVSFFSTKDSTAIGVTLWDGSDREVFYFTSIKQMDAWMKGLMVDEGGLDSDDADDDMSEMIANF